MMRYWSSKGIVRVSFVAAAIWLFLAGQGEAASAATTQAAAAGQPLDRVRRPAQREYLQLCDERVDAALYLARDRALGIRL